LRDETGGLIYFIGTLGAGVGRARVKIGWTARDPERRLRALQTGSPFRLALLATMPGTRADEYRLQKEFEFYRDRGEWFVPGPRLRSLLQRLAGELAYVRGVS
jgi:hypothetical protein